MSQSEEFFWFREDQDENCIFIGLTLLGSEHCGDIQSVDVLYGQDEGFKSGEILFKIEGDHHSLEFQAIKDGKVASVNSLIFDEPEVIQEDPLEEGWIISIEKTV